MHIANADDASMAAMALLARLIEKLRDKKVLAAQDLADVFNAAITDQAGKSNEAGTVAVIKAILPNAPRP